MLVIGLTGPTGAGKGVLCEEFKRNNIPCLDTDLVARKVVMPDTECLKQLQDYFGREILFDDGALNRKALASIVFSDKKKLEFLNQTTHKYIMNEIKAWISEKEKESYRAAVVDAPLLFESGCDRLCDITIAVLADKEKRLERIINRDKIEKSAAEKRIAAQNGNGFFISRCDYIVYNNSKEPDYSAFCRRVLSDYNIT